MQTGDVLSQALSRSDTAETYLARFTRRMQSCDSSASAEGASHKTDDSHQLEFPFVSISVLSVLLVLFVTSFAIGGWTWSTWTYSFALCISIPLTAIERYRNAILTGGAALLLFLMVIIDAGMPQYFGYSMSSFSSYDLLAHYLGAAVLTLFAWSFVGWARYHDGPPRSNGTKMFVATIMAMVVAVTVFEFIELMTDDVFGWTNFNGWVDTAGDLAFDIAGISTAAIIISRHKVSALRRPFWHLRGSAS